MTRTPGLKRIVLVHGAAHGAWCWEEVIPRLEAKGYAVDAPDLPAHGADRTPAKAVTFADYVARVVETLRARPEPALLVGHSAGGATISQAAEDAAEQVGRLVYVAACLPRDGEFLEMMIEISVRFDAPSAADALGPCEVEGAHGFAPALVTGTFYNRCDADTARRAAARVQPEPDAPRATPIRLSASRWGRIPKTYILCTEDRALPPGAQREMSARAPGVKTLVMATDHSPFFSDAAGLTDLLDEEARG